VSLLHLFSSELSRRAPNVELLKRIFASLETTEFPGFVRGILTLTGNLAKTPIEDQLLQLKEIRNRLLMVELNDHIVAQYAAVREQRRQHALDAITLAEIREPSLRSAEEKAEKVHTALTYENRCIEYILAQHLLNGRDALFLLRTLSSSLAAKYEALVKSSEEEPSVAGCLEELARRNTPHIESSAQLLEKIRKLGFEITVQANELIAAVKTGAPVVIKLGATSFRGKL